MPTQYAFVGNIIDLPRLPGQFQTRPVMKDRPKHTSRSFLFPSLVLYSLCSTVYFATQHQLMGVSESEFGRYSRDVTCMVLLTAHRCRLAELNICKPQAHIVVQRSKYLSIREDVLFSRAGWLGDVQTH